MENDRKCHVKPTLHSISPAGIKTVWSRNTLQIITKPNKPHHYNKTLLDMSKIYKIVIKDAWTWIKFQ